MSECREICSVNGAHVFDCPNRHEGPHDLGIYDDPRNYNPEDGGDA